MPRPGTTEDEASQKMLFLGCSVTQLGILFKMDNRTVAEKIKMLQPSGKRLGYPTWKVYEAAPFLCKPIGDIEEIIKNMHHRDLPPMLLKEFWSGQRAKQDYLENEGDLWRTTAVIEAMADAFKVLSTSIRLTRDRVERESELSDKQRAIIDNIIDGTLQELHKALIERFEHEAKRGSTRSSDSSARDEADPEEDPAEGL